MDQFIQVVTATKTKADAEKIAKLLLEEKLAGCVQVVGPMTSYYRWKRNIEEAQEFICFIKTKKELYRELEKKIKEIHPYEIPEIIMIPIEDGNKDYLEWLKGVLKK